MIRAAQCDDTPGILGIWNPIIRETTITFTNDEKTPRQIEELIKERGSAFLVGIIDGEIAGLASFGAFRSGPGYGATVEHTVLLAPAARGQGLGRRLMAVLQSHAKGSGAHVMVGGISAENQAGIAFHKAIGFDQTGYMPQVGRKFGRWQDLVLMQKTL